MRKGPVTYKTPDFSKVKAKVCFGKSSDTPKVRFGAKKASDLPSSADGGKELRKRPLHIKPPDFSQMKPKVHFPKSGYTPPKSSFSVKKESDLPSRAEPVKEVTLVQEDDTLLLQQMYDRMLVKILEAENALDEMRLKTKQDKSVSADIHSGTVTSESPLSSAAPSSPLHRRASFSSILSYSPSPSSNRDDALTPLTPLTPLTSSESANYDCDERMSDFSSGTNEYPTADKFTETPVSTNSPASASTPLPNHCCSSNPMHIICTCDCLCYGHPEADVNYTPSVHAELQPCAAACTPPHRKGPVTYKTPDFSKVKAKLCFGKSSDTPKVRFDAKKASDLPSSADGGKELRKRPLHIKPPDFSQMKPKVHFPKSGYTPPKSSFSVKKESDLPSRAEPVKEVTLVQEDDTLLLQQMYDRMFVKILEAENALDEMRLKTKQDKSVSADIHSGTVTSESPLSSAAPSSPLHRRASFSSILSYSPSPSSNRDDALTPLTPLTSSESANYDCDERMSDFSSGTNEYPTADKFTETPASTNSPASASTPLLNHYVNYTPSVHAELQPCAAACTPPHRFYSGCVSEYHPHTAVVTPTYKVKGHQQTSSSVRSALGQAVRIAGEIKKNSDLILESARRCQQLLSVSPAPA